jgi:hypothetical protein
MIFRYYRVAAAYRVRIDRVYRQSQEQRRLRLARQQGSATEGSLAPRDGKPIIDARRSLAATCHAQGGVVIAMFPAVR